MKIEAVEKNERMQVVYSYKMKEKHINPISDLYKKFITS